MNKNINNILNRLNPRNLSIGNKVHFTLLSLVLFALIFVFAFGFKRLYSYNIQSSIKQMQELAYLKARIMENQYNNIERELISLSGNDQLIAALNDFKGAFKSIPDDHAEMFYGDSLNEAKIKLNEYYSETLVAISPVSGNKILDLFPQQEKTLVTQYLYIYNNPNSQKEKKYLTAYNYPSQFAQIHSTHHSYFGDLAKKFNARDIYLADPLTGDIVYSLAKNIDFGVNLYEGVQRSGPLGVAFRKALATARKQVTFIDFTSYAPAFDQPVGFLSVPLYEYDQVTGVLILQVGPEFFDNILYDNYLLSSFSSLEFNVIGTDLKLRNNPKDLLRDPKKYKASLTRKLGRKGSKLAQQITQLESGAILLHYPDYNGNQLLKNDYMNGADFSGEPVIASAMEFITSGNTFYLVAKMDKKEVLTPFFSLFKYMIFIFILVLIIVFFIGRTFGKWLGKSIIQLKIALNNLYKGEDPLPISETSTDELGDTINSYNALLNRIKNAAEFSDEMSSDNFHYNFEIISENDRLGNSLNSLKDKLIKSKEEHELRVKEDEIRHWLNTGIAKFNDLLRKSNDNIHELSFLLIEEMVNYLNANQGGVFLVEEKSNHDKVITQVAGFAYDRRKFAQKTIELGEGLLGNVYLEKKSIFLKDIPEDYMEISSGLGQSIPRCLYIVPLMIDKDVLGLIEIASFNIFEQYQLEFIEKLAESVAATFVSVRLNMKTSVLLEESNRKAEEISQQEEEMRQNLEEMQATQEELARLRQDDEKRSREMQLTVESTRKMLKNIINAMPGGVVLKDANGLIILANKEGAEYYGLSAEAVVGKTDHEILGAKNLETEHQKDIIVLDQGEQEYTDEKDIKGKNVWYRVIKKPFYIDELRQQGILTIRFILSK